jgi:hypothetical protein
MNNDSIDFKALFGEGPFADVTDGTVNGGKPCAVGYSCPPWREVAVEREPDWSELTVEAWFRGNVQGLVGLAQDFRRVRGLAPGQEVFIVPPRGVVAQMAPVLDELRSHGIRVTWSDDIHPDD